MTRTKIGILVACVAIGFYVMGSLIGWPGKSPLLAGDAANASKSKIKVVNIDQDAIQEKLQSDSTYRNDMLAAVGLMQINSRQFETLLDATIKNCKSNDKLKTCIQEMKDMQETAHNVNLAIDQLATDMELLSKGEKVPSFEQDLNNATLSFSILDRASTLADMFVNEVSELTEKDEKLETLQAEWLSFGFSNSLLNCNQYHFNNLEQLSIIISNQEKLQGGRAVEMVRNKERLNGGPAIVQEVGNKERLNGGSAIVQEMGNKERLNGGSVIVQEVGNKEKLNKILDNEQLNVVMMGDAVFQSLSLFIAYNGQTLNNIKYHHSGTCIDHAFSHLNAGIKLSNNDATSNQSIQNNSVLSNYYKAAEQLGAIITVVADKEALAIR